MAVGDAGRSEVSAWLADVVRGAVPPWRFAVDFQVARLVEAAQQEGVVAIVNGRLRQDAHAAGEALPSEVRETLSSAARSAALTSMILEAETVAVLQAMAAAGIPGLLLKGNALAYSIYPQPHWRECSDVDVLVPFRDAAEALGTSLCGRGYERLETSGQLVAFELMCRRRVTDDLHAEVDIHWRLANSVLFADVFSFDELMADSVALPALAPNARGLGLVHACIHACIHRALNLSIGVQDKLKWLYDIELMVQKFCAGDWSRLVEVAALKHLAGVVLGALEASASAFRRELPQAHVAALRDAQQYEALDANRLADWRYMQRMTFRSLPTRKQRLQWLWQRAFPSKAYMSYLYSAPGRSYLALMGMRVLRMFERLRSGRRHRPARR